MMRWIPTLILVYAVLLVQTSLERVIVVPTESLGRIGPDLAAVVAVFVALRGRTATDAMLTGWILGLGVDLTGGGGVGATTAVGPMAIAFALMAGAVFHVREAFFRERALTQSLMTLVFVFAAHVMWISIQSIRLGGDWASFKRMLLQVLAVAAYSALLAPLVHHLLGWRERWFIAPQAGRNR
jgi:rod shape-determining protein MreD